MQLYGLYKLLKEELKNGSGESYQEAVKTVVIKRCVLIDEPKGK
ncbi:MAG TPA: hypothetical protein ACFYD0_05095 [Candidatus Wunengus sp. YC65]